MKVFWSIIAFIILLPSLVVLAGLLAVSLIGAWAATITYFFWWALVAAVIIWIIVLLVKKFL